MKTSSFKRKVWKVYMRNWYCEYEDANILRRVANFKIIILDFKYSFVSDCLSSSFVDSNLSRFRYTFICLSMESIDFLSSMIASCVSVVVHSIFWSHYQSVKFTYNWWPPDVIASVFWHHGFLIWGLLNLYYQTFIVWRIFLRPTGFSYPLGRPLLIALHGEKNLTIIVRALVMLL